jgi:hypothetical protein
MNNKKICKKFEVFFNEIYGEFLKTKDLDTLDIVKSLINIMTLKGISFREIIVNDDVVGIKIINSKTPRYPQKSYFLNLETTIFSQQMKNIADQSPSTDGDVNVIEIIAEESVTIPKLKKIGKTVFSSLINCTDLSIIDHERLAKVPKEILDIYRTCGGNMFLNGKKITNVKKQRVGQCVRFFIDYGNALFFRVKVDGYDHIQEWSINSCFIEDPSAKDTIISVLDAIALNKI